jgi:carbon storage regulator CsrA
MLVLSRKRNQSIIIGESGTWKHVGPIRIVIVEEGRGKVRIGIDADKSLPVHRDEVHAAIERNKDGDAA